MRKLIDFFKKLFGYKEVCPECKYNPCKCEIAVPVEHIRTVESVPNAEFAQETVDFPTTVKSETVSASKEEVNAVTKPVIKKKRAPRKKKATTEKK